jgi:hypothetical protein
MIIFFSILFPNQMATEFPEAKFPEDGLCSGAKSEGKSFFRRRQLLSQFSLCQAGVLALPSSGESGGRPKEKSSLPLVFESSIAKLPQSNPSNFDLRKGERWGRFAIHYLNGIQILIRIPGKSMWIYLRSYWKELLLYMIDCSCKQ